ncbi:hypothetical protein ACFYW3_27380, partial [Streptomyces sp. NPDC002602]
TVFNLGKFPADFYLRNFLCEPSIINNGGDVKLTWERSANATYELLYGDIDRDVTNRTSLDIEGIKSDTTFYIRATTGDPTNPVVRIISAQVTVLKPDLEIGNLTVHGAVQMMQNINLATPPQHWKTYETTAPSDGFLFVTCPLGTVDVDVDQFSASLGSERRTATLAAPKGATIRVRWIGDTGSIRFQSYCFGDTPMPAWNRID